jgi:predicted ribosome quality control (RQC) complex YloA/Tae2 family protein
MATAQGMSGVDLRSALTEWKTLLPLWVNKIYQLERGVVVIRLHGKERARHMLMIEPGRRAHLTGRPFSPPKNPPSFAMLLRKHLTGGRVLDIRQHGIQRLFTLDIGKGERTCHLITELYDEGNVVLCDGDYTIIQPLSSFRFKDRDVVPGAPYHFPPLDPATYSEEKFAEFLGADERDAVRALAVGAMLGGPVAEYVCRQAGVEKNTPAAAADAGALYRATRALLARAEGGIAPVVTQVNCLPFPFNGEAAGETGFPSFNQALDSFYPPPEPPPAAAAATTERHSREERIRAQQAAAVEKFNQRIARCERAVEAIYTRYPFVQEVLETLRQASRDRSWQAIEEALRTRGSGAAARILAVHPAEASVEVDLGERVTLYVNETVEMNAGRYYDQIKKLKKKRSGATAAMERTVPERARKAAPPPLRRKKWYHRFRWFITSDGVLVVGGKDASQNEELVKRYMEGGDLFVHADVHGASVVIVKGTSRNLDEAAVFAASYSGAWRIGHFTADVYAVTPPQVSKTPESGEYVSRGSFIIRGERTYFRDVPLGLAIGLQREPEVGVIGGPVSAVKAVTSIAIELRPGTFGPNDIARKVLRLLRGKLPAHEQQVLRSVLNTESVAAFVPPGGSDIVEGSDEG